MPGRDGRFNPLTEPLLLPTPPKLLLVSFDSIPFPLSPPAKGDKPWKIPHQFKKKNLSIKNIHYHIVLRKMVIQSYNHSILVSSEKRLVIKALLRRNKKIIP